MIKGQGRQCCRCERLSVFHSDQALPPSLDALPPNASGPLEFRGVTYRLLTRPLDWTGAVHICDSLNATLASVQDPFQQAYLTLLLNTLKWRVWIGLYGNGVRGGVTNVLRLFGERSCYSVISYPKGNLANNYETVPVDGVSHVKYCSIS